MPAEMEKYFDTTKLHHIINSDGKYTQSYIAEETKIFLHLNIIIKHFRAYRLN